MAIKNKVKTWLSKTSTVPTETYTDDKTATSHCGLRGAPGPGRRLQVVREFERCLKNKTSVSEIHDESELPYSKRETLDAISLEILLEKDSKKIEALKASAIFLADFQKGVGPKPLTLLGISDLDMLNVNIHDLGDLDDPVSTIENNPDKEKYRALRKLADHELAYILTRITAILELKSKPPESFHRPTMENDGMAMVH